MNLSVGYLGLVLLATVCGTVLGSPMKTTSSSAVTSSDTSTINNANAGMLANNYDDVLGELAKGLSVCQDPFIYKGVTYCKLSDELQLDDVSLATDSSLGCVLNGAGYQNGDINRNLCMHMKCNDGAWEYTGEMNKDCGSCKVYENSYVWTFDETKFLPYGHKYELIDVGNFIITQDGMKSPSFELSANLDACYPYPGDWDSLTCVQSITYHELGITVQLVIPPQFIISGLIAEIEVIVNGEVQKLSSGDKSAEAFSGIDGTVLVFEHNHIEEEANLSCVNVVGSQGLSMSLCQHEGKFVRLSVLPMPTLKSNSSKLYGLCNTYTGALQDYLIARNGLKKVPTTKTNEFADSWRSSCTEVGGRCQGINDTCNGVINRGLGCNQQVCCIERKGCELDNIPYEEGEFNDNTCMTMQCRNGAWEFTGQIKEDCGNCTVEGDPHILMFDNTTFLPYPGNKYQFGGKGNYVITQHGLQIEYGSPLFGIFGLNAFFETCNTNQSAGLTCVQNITYYEPGIKVEVDLPDQTTDTTFPNCTRLGHNPSDDPNCQFKVKISDTEVRPTGRAMNFQATFGSVLIFTHNHIGGDADLFCMNIVGSRGFSVSLCQHESNFSWLYVLPMPTLKQMPPVEYNPSKLYGLCNTYTGQSQGNFTGKQQVNYIVTELLTQNKTIFGNSWHIDTKETESCEEAGGVCVLWPTPCQGDIEPKYDCGHPFSGKFCCLEEATSEKSTQNISQEE